MKYMSFNSSCSYAGVANMLEILGADTEDYKIAIGMKIPYMLDKQDGIYISGPMLQTKEWFNLYLNSVGYEMTEQAISKDKFISYISEKCPCMFGSIVDKETRAKHAIIFIGKELGKYKFINNKRKDSTEPDFLIWTEEELMAAINAETMVATIRRCSKKKISFRHQYENSLQYLKEIDDKLELICNTVYHKNELRELQEKIFRCILLDNITALRLASENQLADKFETIQKQFLNAVREKSDEVRLSDYIKVDLLRTAISDWYNLINEREK